MTGKKNTDNYGTFLRQKKKKNWIGVTRPTLFEPPTLEFFFKLLRNFSKKLRNLDFKILNFFYCLFSMLQAYYFYFWMYFECFYAYTYNIIVFRVCPQRKFDNSRKWIKLISVERAHLIGPHFKISLSDHFALLRNRQSKIWLFVCKFWAKTVKFICQICDVIHKTHVRQCLKVQYNTMLFYKAYLEMNM